MAGGFGFAPPLSYLKPPSAQAMDDPVAAAAAAATDAQKNGGSLSGDINRVKSVMHSMGLGGGPSTPYVSSPMLPSTPAVGDMSGAVGDAVNNVAAAGPGAFSGDAATAGLGDAAAGAGGGLADIGDVIASLFI